MTLIPSEIITVYTQQTQQPAETVMQNFTPEKYTPPPSASSKHVRLRLLLTFCEKLSHSPSKTKRIELAMEWLCGVLHRAEGPGLDISAICTKAVETQNGFDLDELADAICFLNDHKYIHKLGISHEKYVHYKVQSSLRCSRSSRCSRSTCQFVHFHLVQCYFRQGRRAESNLPPKRITKIVFFFIFSIFFRF